MKDFGSFGGGFELFRRQACSGPLGRLHPGVKAAGLVIGIGTISLISSASGLFFILCCLLWAAGISGLSPSRLFRPLLPVAPFLVLLVLLHGVTRSGSPEEALLSRGDILPMLIMSLRIITLMGWIGLSSATVTTPEVSYGIESLFSPLERLGFPAGELGLIATVTFRFIPFLREESERLAKAQTARGGSLGFRSANPFRRMKAALPTMVPLFIGTLRRAEVLAESMHLRGYDEKGSRIRLRRYRLKPQDLLWSAAGAAVLGAALLMQYAHSDARLVRGLIHIIFIFKGAAV
ncbi:energy-coupling factor transporter transmembrane component T [Marispirochaeta aestuarii]|uniref:energy-coupling factor transporter transmembrane component T family protein n=1 Tax=Marispirochaeta aestuarii TaxID=1963862 RepID=UPI0029C91E70|nr:energy-coupling factor transporter transmembrane component T [Marispirochaeta aestuarii]